LDFDDEKIEEIFVGDTQTTKVVTKEYNLRRKETVTNTPLPSKIVISPKKITPPIIAQKQSNPSQESTIPITSQPAKNTGSFVNHSLDYNAIEDMKKTKANISIFDISSLPQQRDMIINTFKSPPSQQKTTPLANNNPKNIETKIEDKNKLKSMVNATSIRSHSRSQVLPFLLTIEIFNFNMHNFLEDSGASSNVMPYSLIQKLNVFPEKSSTRIIKLDRSNVKFMGELKYVTIRLTLNPRVQLVIDIIVVDIPEAYGLLLRKDWSAKLQGYFSTNWSHLWIPYKGRMYHIRVDNEAHMKHTVMKIEGKNKPINFAHSILANCFLETNHGCYALQPSSLQSDEQFELLHCTQVDENDCIIVETTSSNLTNPTHIQL
jgi:hypothetical protein